MDDQLISWTAALLAICIGVFFTHRIFVKFIVALLRAKHEDPAQLDRHTNTGHLLRESAQIVLGVVPLVWGIARLWQLA